MGRCTHQFAQCYCCFDEERVLCGYQGTEKKCPDYEFFPGPRPAGVCWVCGGTGSEHFTTKDGLTYTGVCPKCEGAGNKAAQEGFQTNGERWSFEQGGDWG